MLFCGHPSFSPFLKTGTRKLPSLLLLENVRTGGHHRATSWLLASCSFRLLDDNDDYELRGKLPKPGVPVSSVFVRKVRVSPCPLPLSCRQNLCLSVSSGVSSYLLPHLCHAPNCCTGGSNIPLSAFLPR